MSYIKNNKIAIYLFILAGILSSIFVYYFISYNEEQKIKKEFIHKSQNILNLFETTIEKNINSVILISSIFSNLEEEITRAEFNKITNSAIDINSITTGISWNPYVKEEQKEFYEKRAKEDGLLDFEFSGLDENGRRVKSLQKPYYIPVLYIEPQEKNRDALGFDISSNKARNEAINEAKETKNIIFTSRINLVQRDKDSFGTLAIKAVFKDEIFKGIIVGVFSFEELGSKVLEQSKISNITIELKDVTAPKEKQLLYKSETSETSNKQFLKWEESLKISNKKWVLQTSITDEYIQKQKSIYPILFFINGLFFTFFIASYLISKANRTKVLEEKVQEQTKNLTALNLQLKQSQDIAKMGSWEIVYKTKEFKITDEFREIYGMTNDRAYTLKDLVNVIYEGDRESVINILSDVFISPYEGSTIYRIVVEDKIKYIDVNWRLKYEDGKFYSFQGYSQDITLKKEQEFLLLEQSKLASMGEMIGNIAHQWRQPLSIITTTASGTSLTTEFGNLTIDELKKNMNLIVTQSEYLSKTIDDFKNFIRGDKVFKKTKISEIIDSSLELTKASLDNNYIKVILQTEDDLEIEANKSELNQAIINIINNSKDVLKTKDEDSKYLFISTKKVDENSLKLEILDNGGGIIEDQISRIFEPYFSTKHKSIGTGLGLSMAYKIIVERHNQAISAENKTFAHNGKLYKGALFTITFTKM